jgi:hypothetical protein
MGQRPNYKAANFETTGEKHRENSWKHRGIDNAFPNRTPIAQGIRARIDKGDVSN